MRWMQGAVDERLIVVVILLNTLAMFLRGFPAIDAAWGEPLFAIDYACTVYFSIEIAIKVRLQGFAGFLALRWNRFDAFVVALSQPMLLAPWIDLEGFSLVLILRLGRVLRAFRLLRFVPDADRLWSGIRRALKASVGVLIALAVYNLVLGLCGRYLLGDVDPAHFGDPLTATYSMFKVFTVEGWYEIPDAIAQSHPEMANVARAFFIFAVATGGILGLSMANAVFVDEMVMDNTDELEAKFQRMKDEIIAAREENKAMLESVLEIVARIEEDRAGQASDEA